MFTSIHSASLPAAFASAESRIILHTSLYAYFARNAEYSEALEVALARPNFQKLHAIMLPFESRKAWHDEFLSCLAPNTPAGMLEHEFNSSRDFLVRLAAKHDGLVALYESRALPCAPIIIVDDRIYFGHYCHGSVPITEGLWFTMTVPVTSMLYWLEDNSIPQNLSPTHRATFRFVSECYYAMKHAKKVLF